MTDDELLALYSFTTYRAGLNRLATDTFGKPLNELSDDQIVTMMAIDWYPSPAHDAVRLGTRRAALLARLKAENSAP